MGNVSAEPSSDLIDNAGKRSGIWKSLQQTKIKKIPSLEEKKAPKVICNITFFQNMIQFMFIVMMKETTW